MDEFQFRPLTEGLGFHKKTVDLKEEMEKSEEISNQNTKVIPMASNLDLIDLPTNDLQDRVNQLLNSIPSEEEKKAEQKAMDVEIDNDMPEIIDPISKTDIDINEIPLEEPQKREKDSDIQFEIPKLDLSTEPETTPKNPSSRYQSANYGASILDAVVITGMFMVFTSLLLMVIDVDIFSIVLHPMAVTQDYLSVVALFFSSIILYQVLARSFYGSTLGEWAMDLRVGSPEQLNETSYSVKVFVRSLLLCATGVIVMPLLSKILGKDILGHLLGIPLQEREI